MYVLHQHHDSPRCKSCGQELQTPDRQGLVLLASRGEVRRLGKKTHLRPHVMMVLECLYDAYPGVATRESIFDTLYDADSDRQPSDPQIVLRVYISRLRKALAPLGMRVINNYGYGYQLEFSNRAYERPGQQGETR